LGANLLGDALRGDPAPRDDDVRARFPECESKYPSNPTGSARHNNSFTVHSKDLKHDLFPYVHSNWQIDSPVVAG
jgi:hypothetical protein